MQWRVAKSVETPSSRMTAQKINEAWMFDTLQSH